MANEKVNEREQGSRSQYVRGVKSELKKVVWPSKDKLIKYSALVIVVSIISSLLVYLFDFIVQNILKLIIG